VQAPDFIRPTVLFLAFFGLTLAVLASVQTSPEPPPRVRSAEAPRRPDFVAEEYSSVAEAFRQGNFESVEQQLLSLASEGKIEARVLLGLYARASERDALALEQLQAAEAYKGDLQDWRLWALATSADILGRDVLSHAALSRLIEESGDSPLRSPAVVLLAAQAVERSDWISVVELDRRANDERLDPATREHLARLTWQAAERLDAPAIERLAAKRLLTEFPLAASELSVVDVFRLEEGTVPWTSFLTPDDILRRSRSLIQVGLPESALETLALMPEGRRDLDWFLAQAQALTDSQQGESALALLEPIRSAEPAVVERLEWARAEAAHEASTARRDRRNVTAEQRKGFRSRAHRHLENVAAGDDPELAIRALRILFANLLEDERFEDAVDALERLQSLDPTDTTGAQALWALGWKAYEDRNFSTAIGYWTELAALYPRSNYNRGGLYWSARSHEQLGNRERARELLRLVVEVDFTDIYRRHALARLEEREPPAAEESASEPWPVDPRLARVELLFRLGLDEEALIELSSSAGKADSRATDALRAQILAAQGNRRQSIITLRRAFPVLGTPHQGLAPLKARHLYYPLDFAEIISEQARARGLESHLVLGLIRQESAFDFSATSSAGARGLMQIMPATGKELARRLGLRYSQDRLSDPAYSVRLGTLYLSQVLEMFEGEEVLALAGYNAGPYRIKRLWQQAGSDREIDRFLEQLSYPETRNYVKRVLLYSDSYRRLYRPAG
jgi:soluble lytic murein transglycosylase-like protein/TolA-binding protein